MPPSDDSFQLGSHVLRSRLIVGTGKYESFEIMRDSLDLSGTDCITVAVRRERLYDGGGRNILDYRYCRPQQLDPTHRRLLEKASTERAGDESLA